MPDLHTLLHEAIQTRLAIARAATPGPWTRGGIGDFGWSVHFPGNDGWQNMGIETEDGITVKNQPGALAFTDFQIVGP